MNNLEEVTKRSATKKTFKEYYEDPEFKKKHQKYCAEEIECECGRTVRRNFLTKHRKTKIHQRDLNTKLEIEDLRERKKNREI